MCRRRSTARGAVRRSDASGTDAGRGSRPSLVGGRSTYRSGPSFSTPPVRCRVRHERPRARQRPHRPRRDRGHPGGCDQLGLLAARRLHARRDARAVHDVRRGDRAGAGGDAGVRSVRRQGRRRRLVVGRGARPTPQPPAARRWRGAGGRGGRGAADSSSRTDADFTASTRSGSLLRGGVSERPKEHASKACVG